MSGFSLWKLRFIEGRKHTTPYLSFVCLYLWSWDLKFRSEHIQRKIMIYRRLTRKGSLCRSIKLETTIRIICLLYNVISILPVTYLSGIDSWMKGNIESFTFEPELVSFGDRHCKFLPSFVRKFGLLTTFTFWKEGESINGVERWNLRFYFWYTSKINGREHFKVQRGG